ncbi:MAG: magnesium transporter [Thiotrichales bacterium]
MQNDATPLVEESLLDRILALLASEDDEGLRRTLARQHPADIANALEALPRDTRSRVWHRVPAGKDADVLASVNLEVRNTLIRDMEPEELIAAAEIMDTDDLAEVIHELPSEIGEALKSALSRDIQERLETSLTFDEDTAGRLMSRDVVNVRADVTVEVVMRYLRFRRQLPPHTDGLMVVNRDGKYLGKVDVAALLTHDLDETVAELMIARNDSVVCSATSDEVADLFERHDLVSAAVVSDDGILLGRITIDDVVDLIRERANSALLNMAGLHEDEDLFAPAITSAGRRSIWLGINLMTAVLASWVIGMFEGALEKIVALAILMPIVASMGGIAGSQTLTLTIRGLALRQIVSGNVVWLLRKEILIGIANGILWALVVAAVALFWFKNWGIGGVIAAAIMINLLAAAIAGLAIPLLLERAGIDPAISAAVILTTVTDVIGFMSFLGLASLFLL